MQEMNYHHKVILQIRFESKTEQDSCVWPVTRGSIWHLDLKVQNLKYHHNVILQSSFESKREQDSCVWPVTRGSIWHLDLKVQGMNYHHKVILQSSFESKSLHCDRFNLTPRLETACHESSPQSHCKTSHCVTKRLGGRLVFYQKTPKPVDVFWNFSIFMSILWKRVCKW